MYLSKVVFFCVCVCVYVGNFSPSLPVICWFQVKINEEEIDLPNEENTKRGARVAVRRVSLLVIRFPGFISFVLTPSFSKYIIL